MEVFGPQPCWKDSGKGIDTCKKPTGKVWTRNRLSLAQLHWKPTLLIYEIEGRVLGMQKAPCLTFSTVVIIPIIIIMITTIITIVSP